MHRPYFRRFDPTIHYPRAGSQPQAWDMPDLCRAYNYPNNLAGPPQKIGIIELGGAYYPADTARIFARWNLPAPNVTPIILTGASQQPGNADGEVALDVQIAAAAYTYCTGKAANINLYFARNDNQAFAAAVRQAVLDGCGTIGISWGSAEQYWGGAAGLNAFAAACATAGPAGTTIFAAAGDNDSGDGTNGVAVDFPASCPFVIGCGGTHKSATDETVWNDGANEGTGGGYSAFFPVQPYQVGAPTGSGRLVPDLAANASPATGYVICQQGQFGPVGGTSAVAPLMAGLFAAFNSALKGKNKPALGQCHDRLYRHPAAFRDITVGNNGRWRAASGIDPCTGLGVPDGTALWLALDGSIPGPVVPPVQPPPTTNPPTGTPISGIEQAVQGILHLSGFTTHTPPAATDSWSVGK